jgi:hypothetical protein
MNCNWADAAVLMTHTHTHSRQRTYDSWRSLRLWSGGAARRPVRRSWPPLPYARPAPGGSRQCSRFSNPERSRRAQPRPVGARERTAPQRPRGAPLRKQPRVVGPPSQTPRRHLDSCSPCGRRPCGATPTDAGCASRPIQHPGSRAEGQAKKPRFGRGSGRNPSAGPLPAEEAPSGRRPSLSAGDGGDGTVAQPSTCSKAPLAVWSSMYRWKSPTL